MSNFDSDDDPFALSDEDPFALPPDPATTEFGLDAKTDSTLYKDNPFDLPGDPAGEHKQKIARRPLPFDLIKQILPERDRDKLLINHDSSVSRSSKQVLDGFSVERLLQCYADDISDDLICKYLRIRPGQLKSWLAMSQQKISSIKRLQDIKRFKKIDDVIDNALDYEVGKIIDKADAAEESLKLDAMKMRSKVALDLDSRSRYKDESDGASLPVVNIGLQVTVDKDSNGSLDHVRPVIPGIVSSSS